MPQPRWTHGQVVEKLAMRVVTNEYTEGTTLDQSKLRTELRISGTMLREAVRVLEAKGFIESRQKRGTLVLPRSSWHILDQDVMRWCTAEPSDPVLIHQLIEVRAALEPTAARMAAERATESDLAKLQAALDAMAEATDYDGAVAADIAFHRHLLLATHNEPMAQLIAIDMAKRKRSANDANLSELATSHRAVLNAVLAHDPAAAERAMYALACRC